MAEAAARAGLVGHPSDGYGGATMSVTLANFAAEVHAAPSASLDVAPEGDDQWPEGGLPLVNAAIERFARHCETAGASFDPRVRIRYRSTIPRQVGLGGSSAIVIATLRALCARTDVELAPTHLPALALAVETEGLGIAAGLQDRVVQTYGGLVFMDFDSAHDQGRYEPLGAELLPPLFIAWRPDAGTSSGSAHADVRDRFERGDARIVGAMGTLAQLAHDARAALFAKDHDGFAAALDAGYDVRASIFDLDPRHTAMIERARALGLSATYTGSGGAIVGIASDPDAVHSLQRELAGDGVRVQPALVGREEGVSARVPQSGSASPGE
jgi:glucuronokinase